MEGILYGVGVGSGDPEELTLKALRILQESDYILVPVSKPGLRSQAYRAVESYIKDQEIVELYFPMTTDREVLVKAWEESAQTAYQLIQQGKKAAFITIGDVSIYSTFTYMAERVKEMGGQVKLIAGIPSFCSIAARAGQSLCDWEEPLLIYPSNYNTEKIRGYVKEFDNLVLMKAAKEFDQVVDILEENQALEQSYLITKCGYEEEEIVTDLKSKQGEKINYLSTIIVNKKKER